MGVKQTTERLVRQWRILEALQGRRRGLTAAQLAKELETSRATLYRDLKVLLESSLPIVKEVVTGETRYVLMQRSVSPLPPSARQIAALYLARRMLEPLDGSALVGELDGLLARWVPQPAPAEPVTVPEPRAALNKEHVRLLEQAVEQRRRARLRYLGIGDRNASHRTIEALELRLRDGQLYVMAVDVEKQALRTFKVSRIEEIELLSEQATASIEYDPDEVFRHSMGVWSGEPIDVEIRLSSLGRRFLQDWPLAHDQEVVELDDGGAVVKATVAGDIEVLRWVTRWGRHAEVLAPAGLREAVRDELLAALAKYEPNRVSQAS